MPNLRHMSAGNSLPLSMPAARGASSLLQLLHAVAQHVDIVAKGEIEAGVGDHAGAPECGGLFSIAPAAGKNGGQRAARRFNPD